MAAFGFRALGWALCVSVVAPGFYLVSSQVAGERARLEAVERAIAKAKSDIRTLETEFNTRANLAQLERWNGDVLALAAPRAEQFVGGEAMLAQLPGREDGQVQYASYIVPSGPVDILPPVAATDAVPATTAHATTAAPAAAVPAAASASVSAPVSRAPAATAPVQAIRRTTPAATAHAASTKRAPEAAARKAQAVAMLDQRLLSDSTLGDLVRGARAEAVGKR